MVHEMAESVNLVSGTYDHHVVGVWQIQLACAIWWIVETRFESWKAAIQSVAILSHNSNLPFPSPATLHPL